MGILANIFGKCPPACIDCKWHSCDGDPASELSHICDYPDKGVEVTRCDLMLGGKLVKREHAEKSCAIQRIAQISAQEWNTCGYAGRFFESKETPEKIEESPGE